MFSKRLTIALAVLATAAVVEGLLAIWALGVADRQVQRGRVASDIQLGFVELSATKQRLRTWVSQQQMGASADPAVRDRLLADMRATLARLHAAAERAASIGGATSAAAEHAQRQEVLAVLGRNLDALEREVRAVAPLELQTDAREAWAALSAVFDMSEGRDLRGLLGASMARESAAVVRERAAADDSLRFMRALWLGAAAALALASLLLAIYFAQALRRPLARLHEGAQALQRGDLQHRIGASGNDEFAAVGRSLDSMAAELAEHREREAQARLRLEELVRARTAELEDALQALQQVDARRRQLFADISHELRTPTTAIRGEAEITLRGRDKSPEEYKAALQRIVGGSSQLGMVIDDLLTVARSDIEALALIRQPLDLGRPFAEALAQAHALSADRQVEVRSDTTAEQLPMLGDPLRLRQLLMLLIDNAMRYSRPGGLVQVSLQRVLDGAQPCGEVRVLDHGIGIAAEDLPRVFDRNFRGDAARRHRADGSGLGLAIGAALARAHGGSIALTSEPGRGTTALLRLPLSAPATGPQRATPP